MEIDIKELYKIMFPNYSDVLKLDEVSEALAVNPKTVYQLLNKKTIKSVKTGREFRIAKIYLIEYVLGLEFTIYE